jgi:gas vesicle protein
MSDGSHRGSITFIAGMGVGLAVGIAATLFLAPLSGADARRALRRRGRRATMKAGDAWEDLRLELAHAARSIKRKRSRSRHQADSSQD